MKLDLFEDIHIFLPKYLSTDGQKKLFNELEQFPNYLDKRFFSTLFTNSTHLLQGDGICLIPMIESSSMTIHKIMGLVISNTCDISLDNPSKYYLPSITFAPLFNLKDYESRLLEDKHPPQSVATHIDSIKKQELTSFFYIPAFKQDNKEYFAGFDHLFSFQLEDESAHSLVSNRLFTLSDYGFYLLLLKISIHFSRIQERVERG